jgi:hypothetical protein
LKYKVLGKIYMPIGWPELLLFAIILIVLFSAVSRPAGQVLRAFLDGLSGKLDKYGKAGYQGKEQEKVSGKERSGDGASRQTGAGDPYKILDIPPGATQEQIRSAYKKLAHMYHPDKVQGLAPEYRQIADQKMKAINAAYEQLKRKFES